MTADDEQSPPGSLRERWRRNRLTGIAPGARAWVITAWVLSAALLTSLVWPGALSGIEQTAVTASITGFALPLWLRILAALCGGVLTAITTLLAAERADARGSRWAIGAGVLAALPALLLAADRAWILAVAALVLGLAAILARRLTTRAWAPVALAPGSWLVLGAAQFTAVGSSPTSWVWVVLLALSAAVAAFGTYYGVAGAAEGRTARMSAVLTAQGPGVGIAICLAAAGVVVARLTVLRDLFPPPDGQLWTIEETSPVSWILATLVAGMLVAIAVRSRAVPLVSGGQRVVTAGLAVLGNLHLIVGAVLVVIAAIAAAAGAVAPDLGWQAAVPALKVAGVVALGLLVLHPRFRGTAARWLVVIAVLFLLPATVQSLIGTEPRFAPTPVQVVILIVAAAVVLSIARVVGVRVGGDVVVRLAVIPLIAVHAGWLLPAAWTPLGLALGALLIVAAALFAAPVAQAPGSARTRQSLGTASTRLATLSIAVLAAPSLLDDPSLIVLGLIWLSIVISAALCFTTTTSTGTPSVRPTVEA